MRPSPVGEQHPIYASLYKSVLFLGVEQPVAILEATIVFALLVGVGLNAMTLIAALLIICGLHPLMQALTTRDDAVSRVYLRSIATQDYYPPHGTLRSRAIPMRVSIPIAR